MTITINTNTSAMTAQRNLGSAAMKSAASLAKLSSGSRVPTAKDDAAALAIGQRLNSEVVALRQAGLNAGQASSLLQIADGALGQVSDILSRMQALAVQSNSGQLSDTERTILNTEFTALRSEVDRISADTKFNGVQLLAGTTEVTSNTNDLVAVSGSAGNLISEGFEEVIFASGYGEGSVKIDYDATTDAFTLTNLDTQATETVSISASAISAGATETVEFNNLGVTLVLNDQFDKTTDINAAGTATADIQATDVTATAGGGGTITVHNTNAISAVTGVNAIDLDAIVVTFDATAANAATLTGPLVVGGQTFQVQNNATVDLTNTSAQTITFEDLQGNSFDLDIDINAAASNGDTVTFTLAADHTPAVENSSVTVTDITIGDATNFQAGDIDDATVAFNVTTANSATASVTINGNTFTETGINLSTTGTKTIVLEDGNTNSITFTMNVTTAFQNNDSLSVEVAELGQVVGAESNGGGSTSFNFQVGTGTTTSQDRLSVTLTAVDTTSLGINASTIDSTTNANTAIGALNTAVTTLNTARAGIGANQSRLDFAAANIAVATENNAAARSALLDVDVSSEMTEFTSKQVLIQAGVSMLAQANQQPALLLRLLQ